MFLPRRAVSCLTRPTRQLKLNVNHVRPLSTPAPRITYHDKRRDRDIAFYDDEVSDTLREEREQDPFQFKPEFQRRRESAERFAEQPIQDLSELQRNLIKYEPRRKSLKASTSPLQSKMKIQIMLYLSWLSETCAHVLDVSTNPPARSSSRLSTFRQKLP